jgi:hypothetical protein
MKAILAGAILSLIIGVLFFGVVNANPNPVTGYPPTVMIVTPISSKAGCYSNSSIPVDILVTSQNVISINYSLDEENNITFPTLNRQIEGITANTTLHNLSEGNHTLIVYSLDSDGKTLTNGQIFTVDSRYITPSLALISPKNKTYSTNEIPLIFSINADYRNVRYYLDGTDKKSIYISGNTTIPNLPDGKHTILVFADFSDKYHNWSPTGQGTSFAIDTTNPQNNFVPNNQVIIIGLTILAIVILAIIVLFYRRRRKQL